MNGLEDLVEQQVNLNINCKVCGEKNFELREGFYYCNECGTQQDQIHAVLVDNVNNFGDVPIIQKRSKIQKDKIEELDLTSWECYNYVLRGLVEELISIGAKDDLKLMTLQLWAAFLRRNQVAFFNKKHADLPKLNVGFKKRDAKVLYNHCVQKRVSRRKSKSDAESNLTSEASSRKLLRKSKRKLDESVYSQHSSFTNISTSETYLSSSTSGASNRPIQLKFSSRARKTLKQIMHPNHLKKHEKDALCTLRCHNFSKLKCNPTKSDTEFTALNMKQLYALLAIALNLVEDDIQLSDLLRFVAEGHVSTRNVLKYFPENAMKDVEKILREIGFHAQKRETYENKIIRDQMAYFTKCIQIRSFKHPNILNLIQRYITELSLPQDVYIYAERLFNLLPPTMKTRAPQIYPNFEGRAMAYIIFVLKLFFGLDGYKEDLISSSCTNINKRIISIAEKHNCKEDRMYPKLFVWKDWVEYIEMRKVIISQYSRTFNRQFKQRQTVENCLKELVIVQKSQSEEESVQAVRKAPERMEKIANMQRMFEELCSTLGTDSSKLNLENISFEPSLTPAYTYFKKLLLMYNMDKTNCFPIPEYMHIDHSQRSLLPHLDTRPLCEFLKKGDVSLDIKFVTCEPERKFIGYFWNIDESFPGNYRIYRADFDINVDDWSNEIKARPIADSLLFKTELDPYKKRYLKEQQKKVKLRVKFARRLNDQNYNATDLNESLEDDLRSLPSISVFREDNMDVLENVKVDGPIRNMNGINILQNTSEDENLIPSSDKEADENLEEKLRADADIEDAKLLTFATSKMDYWLLLGTTTRILEYQRKALHQKFPRSFVWLLDTCAQTIGVDWLVLYEQLLAIEVMFSLGIQNLDNFTDCLRLKYDFNEKELTALVSSFREIW